MIYSSVSHLNQYRNIGTHMALAIDYILNTSLETMPPGRYEVAGDNVFAIINEYQTLPASQCEPETHRRYTDIQLMISGSEKFGFCSLNKHKPTKDFEPDGDVAFYDAALLPLQYLILKKNDFIIFFPSDIHQPEIFVDLPSPEKNL
jgi:YhcH/YjgK/YiaL family protein